MAVPRHLAVIMDGNGRWAQARGLPRVAGHRAGAESVRVITRECGKLGVDVLTLYSFSTENWGRPEDEVEALMALLEEYLHDEIGELMQNRVRLRAIGQIDRLPAHVQQALTYVESYTAGNDGLTLVLALSYGGRAEIVNAAKKLAAAVASGKITVDQIDEQAVADALYTKGLPDPDLLVRTSGELRLSNFLPWQLAYAELYVTDVPWPDFREAHLHEAFAAFTARQRRFGKTGEQVAS